MNFFKQILLKIKRYIFYLVFKFVIKQKGKKFERLFNLYSKFDNFVKIKVQYIDPDYFILDNNKKYKIFPLERIRFYLQGLNARFEILNDVVDFFIVCESKYDHMGNSKSINFSLFKGLRAKLIPYSASTGSGGSEYGIKFNFSAL